MTDQPTPILSQNACDLSAAGTDAMPAHLGQLVQQRLNTLGPTSMLFYQKPLELVCGEGVWLYDADGRVYLDVYNNVPILGHGHPAVVSAVSQQLATLNTHTRYLDRRIHDYAERLMETVGMEEGRLVFTCSGSEANDLAMRLARRCTGKQGVIVSEAAYHGNTDLVTQVSPSSYKQGTVPDWVEILSLDELLAADQTASEPEEHGRLSQALAEQTRRAIQRLNDKGYGVAALLVDSVFSSDGVVTHPGGFLAPSVEAVQQVGGWWIADEVQPGFGRCGDTFWGFQRHQTGRTNKAPETQEGTGQTGHVPMPDVVTLGKPMGNGFPVAGMIAQHSALAELNRDVGYFNTFGGSNAAVAAATAVLDILQTQRTQQHAQTIGHVFYQQLNALCEHLPTAHRVRGCGLFFGMDLQAPEGPVGQERARNARLTSAVINHLRQHGVLIGAAGKAGSTLKIRPALCFQPDHVLFFISRLEEAITDVSRQLAHE